MATNIKSLSLLRNGKVYPTRNLALRGFLKSTDDGVAKLCRYRATDGNIKTLVGFYANADQMEDAAGGNSFYTIFDLEALTGNHEQLQTEIDEINAVIGDGIPGTTLTQVLKDLEEEVLDNELTTSAALNDLNMRFGSGFTSAHTVADALIELKEKLTIALTIAPTPTSGELRTYVLTQGEEEIGKIDIPDNRYSQGNGISISTKRISAVAALHSADGVQNPITVDEDGIKFTTKLDCGFFDNDVVKANNASAVNSIPASKRETTNLIVNGESAIETLDKTKVFKSIDVQGGSMDGVAGLAATDYITIDGLSVSGGKIGTNNGKLNVSAPEVYVRNLTIENGSTAYNVFEFEQTEQNLNKFEANNVVVDDVDLKHNVFNIYKPKNNAVIKIYGGGYNLNVENSNILRIANTSNATGVTVIFDSVNWSYEDSPSGSSWTWAGMLMYQPYGSDYGTSGNLDAMKSWTFRFKNCTYNGTNVTENNFGEHNQVFYMYNVNGSGGVSDPIAKGLNVIFE